jgi:hypothetical protein
LASFVLTVALAAATIAVPSVVLAAPAELPEPELVDDAPYPASGDGRRVEVTLHLQVDGEGVVRRADVHTVEPADAPDAFIKAALEHALRHRFSPSSLEGRPVPYVFDHRVVFDPQRHASEADPDVVPVPVVPPEPEPEPAPPSPPVERAAMPDDVREVVVETPKTARRESVTGGDFEFEPGHLADVPRGSAERLLTLAPGLVLYNSGGEGHPSAFFLRGFDAGEGQDIEFTVDGVPINEPSNSHGHGFTDTLFIIPELVSRLRVTEGPFDARQGDFAVAGSAAYELGLDARGVVTKGEYGRFNTGRALVLWGPQGMSRGTFAGVDFKAGDGFGVNRAHQSTRAMAGFERGLGRGFVVDASLQGYTTRYDSAGVLRLDDFDARRVPGCSSGRDAQLFCTYDENQGGGQTRVGGTVRLGREWGRQRFSQNLWVTGRDQRIRENFTGFTTDIRPDGAPQRGDGVEQTYRGLLTGTRGSWGRTWDWWFRPQDVEVGYGVRYDDTRSTQVRLRKDDGIAYTRDFDAELRIVDVSAYTSTKLRPLERLDVEVGLRSDAFGFGVVDHGLPTTDRAGERLPTAATDAFGVAVAPRAATSVHLAQWPHEGGRWDDSDRAGPSFGFGDLDWMTAYGVGTRSSDATALSDGEFAPFARVQSAETGLRARWLGIADLLDLEARSVAFYTHVDRDLVFDEAQGRNVLAGESNRFGVLAYLRASVTDWADVQASVTWSEAYLPPEDAKAFEWTAGPRLPYVPRVSARGDATVFHDFWIRRERFHWTLAVGATYLAPRPLPLDTFGSRYTVVDLAGHFGWRFVEVGLEIQNLFDNRYHQFELLYASNFEGPATRPAMLPQLHFAAGPPLSAMGTVTLHWDPGAKRRRLERRRARDAELSEQRR